MQRPGMISHPGFPIVMALFFCASATIRPQLIFWRTERLRKASTLSERIEMATVKMVFAKIRGNALGKMCRSKRWVFDEPTIFARSTNIRSFKLRTWLRITRAVTDP